MPLPVNNALMRQGMLLVLGAIGLFAVLAVLRLPAIQDGLGAIPRIGNLLMLVSHLAHVGFGAGCIIGWTATTIRLARAWAAIAGGCVAVAWLIMVLGLGIGGDVPFWSYVGAMPPALRMLAMGIYGWYALTVDDLGEGFGRARGGYKIPFLIVLLGIAMLVGGWLHPEQLGRSSGPMNAIFLGVLFLTAIVTYVRLPAAEPPGESPKAPPAPEPLPESAKPPEPSEPPG